jgi:hypothetical protein
MLLLTGCAQGNDEREADAQACEQLVSLTKPENLSLELLNPAKIASDLRSTAGTVAGQELGSQIESLATALEQDPIDTAALAPIATEIALRCTLVGVSFDLTALTALLG